MDGQTDDEQTDLWIDGWTDIRWTDGWMDGLIELRHVRTDRQTDRRMDGGIADWLDNMYLDELIKE